MASIYPTKKEGKIVSYKFRTCIGRDEDGKQIVRCTTWKPSAGLTPAKERKAAKAAAAEWESKNNYISAAAGLRNCVVKNTDYMTVRGVYEKRDRLAYQKLESDTKNLEKNGLNNYVKDVKAQDEANQQAMQVQARQPEPPKAGPVPGPM